uniref:Uncharacterized protein n=1 Tax=Arundo donax TaxID=35708 RepID=A0A0A9BJE1_ARUDO
MAARYIMVSITPPTSATPLVLLISVIYKTGRYLKCSIPLSTRHPPTMLHCIMSPELRFTLENNKLLHQTCFIFAEKMIFPKMQLKVIIVPKIVKLPRMLPLAYVARIVFSGHMSVKLIISIK